MGAPRIVLIHALDSSIEPITSAFAQGWPEARLVNLMDDSLSVDRAAEGCLTPAMTARFDALTRYAVSTGADGILFTCSAFHEAIYAARANVDIPVLTPDEAMMEKALVAGSKITMLATFEPTLATSKAAMEQIAGAAGRQVEVHSVHVPEALAALQGGDPQAHHAKIADTAAQLDDAPDAMLLAQFSMAAAAPLVATRVRCPVLTSPQTSVARFRSMFVDGH